MIRVITLLAVALLVQPLSAQQDAANPFKIVLGNSTISALKSNPKGLVWSFDNLGLNTHDGVTVYYDPTESLVTSWKVNDGTMQNLFSLDVTDEILQQIENDYGLPALISPSDRERIRGVLLRYVPPAGGGLPPSPMVGPIGSSSSGLNPAANAGTSGTSSSTSSVLDNNRVTTNLDSGTQNLRPFGGTSSSSGVTLPTLGSSTGSTFYQNRPAPLQPQANDFGFNRPAFNSATNSTTGSQPLAPPPLQQPIAQQTQALPDRFASNQQLLPPPNYNPTAAAGGYASQTNWQAAAQEPLIPNRRPVQSQFPQVSYNSFPDNQQGFAQQVLPPPQVGAGSVVTQPQGGVLESSATWQTERQALVADLAESKQRSVFLLFMLFLLTGLCLYLSWLARGFYFRYAELADELRETFSATT